MKKIDINSAYPDAMRDMSVPVHFVEVIKNIEDWQVYEYTEKLIKWFRSGKISTWIKGKFLLKDPCLPFRTEAGITRPTGEILGVYVDEELIPRIIDGEVQILEITGIGVYESELGLFSSFVDKHYETKVNSEGSKKETAKLYLNSSYGVFAQRARKYHVIEEPYTLEFLTDARDAGKVPEIDGNKCRFRCGIWYQEEILGYEAYGKCTFISAKITARVRAKMWEELIRPYDPIYCDTDSGVIDFDQAFDPMLLDGKKLGYWKSETINEKFGDWIYVYGSKDYMTASIKPNGSIYTKRTHKGVPAKAIEYKQNTFRFTKILKLREAEIRKLEPFQLVVFGKRRLKWA